MGVGFIENMMMFLKHLIQELRSKRGVPNYLLCFLAISIHHNTINSQELQNFIHFERAFHPSTAIENDSLGNILISSTNGLYKYNGYDFDFNSFSNIFGYEFINKRRVYFTKDEKKNYWLATYNGELTMVHRNGKYLHFKDSLAKGEKSFRIAAIMPQGNLVWFGSAEGSLYKYDYAKSQISRGATLPNVNNRTQAINNIAVTGSQVWISTLGGKVYGYKWEIKQLQELKIPFDDKISHALHLAADKKGKLWISSELFGLFWYEPSSQRLKSFPISDNRTKPSGNPPSFYVLYADSDGNIWAGTDGEGLFKIDKDNHKVSQFRHQDNNRFSISNNSVTNISEDTHGNLWIICKKGVIDILPNYSGNVQYYTGSEDNVPSPILCMLKTSDSSLWIGTDGKGLNRVLSNGKSIQYGNKRDNSSTFKGRYIQRIVESSNKKVWIATYKNGLFIYNPKKDTFSKLKIPWISEKASADIRFLYKDSKNRIWATTTEGILIFDKNQHPLALFKYGSQGLAGNISETICETQNGSIWIGVNKGGLFKFEENDDTLQNSTFKRIEYYQKTHKEDTNNYDPAYMIPDQDNNLWICSLSGTLMFLNTKSYAHKSFMNHDSFKDLTITAGLFDEQNKLWLSSRNGLHQYDIKKDSLLGSYFNLDGLQGDSFSRRGAFKATNGMFYFGGDYGVSAFYPDLIRKNELTPKLAISQIEILNKPAADLVPGQIEKGVENVEFLNLKSDQSSFSFQFAAIGDVLKPEYHYAYRLKGFDKEWITPRGERVATYTNMSPGEYTFEVKAGTQKGIWNIPTKQIAIKIKPPWWSSSIAYGIYAIITGLLFLGIVFWIRLRNKLHREEFQFNKEKELYALKMNFFAKMSHEIQTPLTLITGPIDDMLQRATTNGNQLLRQRLSLIKNNAQRLSRISKGLMTVRDRELDKLRIYALRKNIITDLSKIAASFSEQARFKDIDFVQQYPKEEIFIWYDAEKLEHIFYNLLSNAFKFTPRNGRILLQVKEGKKRLKICVIDSGPGIPQEERDDIFEMFYQSEVGKNVKGLGIGLALTKELVHLHHGKIKVSSSDEGTCFTVSLKTGDIFSNKEKVVVSKANTKHLQTVPEVDLLRELNLTSSENNIDKRATVLIVEDNVDMQIFLRDLFCETYYVLMADNGQEGLKLAKKRLPDLIISDIMMPAMDGITMSKILIKSKATSHIPIVLLTAKDATKTKLAGLQTGALAYIQKPFNPNELLVKVNNILDNKEKTISKHKTDVISDPQMEKIKSKDDLFMERLVKELNNKLESSEFRLEDLADIMSMSYSVIYRKCHDITGKTLVDFYKTLKLKHAALLFLENGYNVSEAGYMVGYKNSKYFTKCFKDEFGKPPMAIKNECKEIGIAQLIKKYNIVALQPLDS